MWLIDEVDNLRDEDAESYGRLIAVLNSGFKETGTVSRLVKSVTKGKEEYNEKAFSTYGPKAFAGLKKLAGTISDRCFHVRMEKASTRPPRMTVRWRKRGRCSFSDGFGGLDPGQSQQHTQFIRRAFRRKRGGLVPTV